MHELGHADISILKFDIEGYEWKVFEDEILKWTKPYAEQLAFELHTEGANPAYVPRELVKNKGQPEVTHLFSQLSRMGCMYKTLTRLFLPRLHSQHASHLYRSCRF